MKSEHFCLSTAVEILPFICYYYYKKFRLDSCRWPPGDGGVIKCFDRHKFCIPDLEKNQESFTSLLALLAGGLSKMIEKVSEYCRNGLVFGLWPEYQNILQGCSDSDKSSFNLSLYFSCYQIPNISSTVLLYLCFNLSILRRLDSSAVIQELFSFLGIGSKQILADKPDMRSSKCTTEI